MHRLASALICNFYCVHHCWTALIYFIQLECDFCSAFQRCGQGGAAEIQSSGVYGCAQVLGQQHHQLPPRERLSQPAPALEYGFCSIFYDT